jgi:ABC-2 type transport system ATP-binding protein
MKQMAKLAQAIVHGPQLIILDEPTNGLDPPARQRMLDMIKRIRDGGHAKVLFSSHLLRDVEECCEEVLILKDGNIAAYCDLEKERSSNVRAVEIETRGDGRGFAEAARAIGCGIDAANDRRMRLILGESVGVSDLYKIAADRGVQLRRLNFKRDSLEEIFLKAMENGHGGL